MTTRSLSFTEVYFLLICGDNFWERETGCGSLYSEIGGSYSLGLEGCDLLLDSCMSLLFLGLSSSESNLKMSLRSDSSSKPICSKGVLWFFIKLFMR